MLLTSRRQGGSSLLFASLHSLKIDNIHASLQSDETWPVLSEVRKIKVSIWASSSEAAFNTNAGIYKVWSSRFSPFMSLLQLS